MAGELADTYVAALQHDLVDLPAGTHLLGVVRKPTPWFHAAVDGNDRTLGPPADLLEELAACQEELASRGLCEEEAHNAAWGECDFESRYRAYLDTEEPADAIDSVLERLRSGTDVALVCYENTERKRCHRTILREELQRQL